VPTASRATTKPRLPKPKLAVERFTLDNGLRVVVSPDKGAPTVAIAVYYDVGFRSEPEGRTGFAHLFEHVAFEGSVHLAKGEADKLIEGNGGYGNGSTSYDYTNYLSLLPSSATELGLFLEADRMRGLRLTEESLRNQIDVVKEEIRVNVLNRPYGGFPWIDLPPVMFRTFNNAHNGYGSFVDLEDATVEDAAAFFDTYYAPANAVLSIAGDVRVDDVRKLVDKLFGDIPARPRPPRGDWDEPLPDDERRATKPDAMAPMPALAVGYRVPDPIDALDDYLASVLLVEVLTDGDSSRLHQRLVKKDRVASHSMGMIGPFGDPFEVRDPTMLQLIAYHPDADADEVIGSIDDEVTRLAAEGLPRTELDRVVTSFASDWFRRLDDLLERAMTIGVLEQQREQGELVNEIPARLASVSPDAVAEAAERWLKPNQRAVLEVRPEGEA
jgi:zinc protease